jgi:hypothetical protein
MSERQLQGKAYSGLGGTRRATLSGHSTNEKYFSAGIGTETTLGLPHAVEMRSVRDMNCMVVEALAGSDMRLAGKRQRPEREVTCSANSPVGGPAGSNDLGK